MGATPDHSIGQLLREKRETLGFSLEEAEKTTRIRARFLNALEEDDYPTLPSAAQARGFLKIYAEYLKLNPEQVMEMLDAGRKRPQMRLPLPGVRPVARPTARPAPPPDSSADRTPRVRSRRPRWLSLDVFVGVIFTLLLGAFLVWGILEFGGGQGFSATATATRPQPQVISLSSTPTPPLAAVSPTAPLPTPQTTYTGVNLIVRAEQRTWLRVVVDGAEAFAGLLTPGTSKEFNGQAVVELTTGNGLGTRVIWNGRDQGTLGQIGEVVIRLWTLEGAITPTPTVTPIPSDTPPPSATPKP